jgi:hypothetical protein
MEFEVIIKIMSISLKVNSFKVKKKGSHDILEVGLQMSMGDIS